MTITTIIVAAIRDPEVATALREVLGSAPVDPWVPLATLAAEIGAPVRAVRLAVQRGELHASGPRCARVVRRSEADRWIESHRPAPRLRLVEDDDREAARAAVQEAAQRAARGRR